MKKIFLLFTLGIIGILTCKAQLTHTSDFVKIALPNGVYKVSKQQVDAMPKFKLSSKSTKSYAPPYAYTIDGIFIGLSNVNQDAINNDIPRKKRFEDEGYNFLRTNGNNSYRSFGMSLKIGRDIPNMGKNQVLLISYTINNDGYYRFYYQNEAKTLTQGGYIDYNIADAVKAEALLNDILNNIEFTK